MSEPDLPLSQPSQTRPEFTVGGVLSRSLSLWASNLPLFLGVSVLLHLPLVLLVAPAPPPGSLAKGAMLPLQPMALAMTVASLLLGSVVNGTLTYAVFEQLRGRPVRFGRALGVGLRRVLPVIGVSIVSGFMALLWGLLLIIPGIMAGCRYWCAVAVTVVEGKGANDSIARSTELTDGYRWHIFGIFVLLMIAALLAGGAIGAALMAMGPGPARYGEIAVEALVGSLSAVIYSVGYYTLRVVKEGIDIQELAAVFD
jgi:hypothetical protein